MAKHPWASGPGEILQHGLSLLREDSDRNRRLAMLAIDNAVELMIKTYLGLPKRVTGLSIKRSEYDEFSEGFPKLLTALEKHAGKRIVGIDLGEIEWYHRLRNQLYHEGNGLTVESEKVTVYAELAKLLFHSLFGIEVAVGKLSKTDMIGSFIAGWAEMERIVRDLSRSLKTHNQDQMRYHFVGNIEDLVKAGTIDADTGNEIKRLRCIRNKVVHEAADIEGELNPELTNRLDELTRSLQAKSDHARKQRDREP